MLAAGLLGALGVVLGAFAAHGLPKFLEARIDDPKRVAQRVEQFETATRYHLTHAVVLLMLATSNVLNPKRVKIAASLLIVGIVIFCGSLYVLVAADFPWMGRIVPIGGVCFIAGWCVTAFSLQTSAAANSDS